jgi:acyl-coenzyme A synthetase/AMP-(fatty) acid ligase
MLSPLLEATNAIITPFVTAGYQELLSEDVVPEYPFERTFDEVKDTAFLGLHTSGTSGHPKPIYWDHLAAATLPAFLDQSFEGVEGSNLMHQVLQGHDVLVLFPLFHVKHDTLPNCHAWTDHVHS